MNALSWKWWCTLGLRRKNRKIWGRKNKKTNITYCQDNNWHLTSGKSFHKKFKTEIIVLKTHSIYWEAEVAIHNNNLAMIQ